MKVNPYIFFKFHEGKFIVWNYRAHEQFELALPYFQRLYELGVGSSALELQHTPITKSLMLSGNLHKRSVVPSRPGRPLCKL